MSEWASPAPAAACGVLVVSLGPCQPQLRAPVSSTPATAAPVPVPGWVRRYLFRLADAMRSMSVVDEDLFLLEVGGWVGGAEPCWLPAARTGGSGEPRTAAEAGPHVPGAGCLWPPECNQQKQMCND